MYDSRDVKIDGGADFDTLKFTDTGVIKLNKAIKNIEKFDLADDSQELTISASDVLSFTDSNNKLFIDGDKSDILHLKGFSQADSSSEAGYNMYTADNGATLFVDEDIAAANIQLM